MALSFDQISAITQKRFIPKLVDNIFDSDPLLQRAKKKFYVKTPGGTSIVQPLGYAQASSSAWYSGSQTLDTTDNDVMTAAEYQWRQLGGTVVVTGRDKRINSGPEQILDFVKQKVMVVEKTLADKLSDGLYSDGTDPLAVVGLQDIIAIDQVVGGISQTTYSWWQAQVNSTTTTLTMSALQTLWNSCCINNDQPTVVMATRSNYNRYYALLQPQQRFMDKDTASGGFQSLMFNGAPFIAGSKVPSSNIMMLNENYLQLYAHKDCDMLFEPFAKIHNQDVEVAKVLWMGAFGSSNNRMHGKLSAIAA